MAYNSTSVLYEYNRSFSTVDIFDWNVTCNKTGVDTLTAIDTLIMNLAPNIDSILLNATTSAHDTTDNLKLHITASDNEGDPIENITTWYSITNSTTILNLTYKT